MRRGSEGRHGRKKCVGAGVYRLQSIKEIEPTHQMTFDPKVNKKEKCVVLSQSLLDSLFDFFKGSEHRNTLCEQAFPLCLGREGAD